MHQSIGKLYVVATPIGNLQDFSQRAYEVLSQVTWIAAEDTRHSARLLHHLGLSKPLFAYHEHNEQERASYFIEKLKKGESGALISDAGTPLISDPGYTLVLRAHEAHISVVPIPGPCAPIAALSVSGLPTDTFLFEGFVSSKSSTRRKRLEALSTFPHTIVFLEAPHRLLALLKEIKNSFGERPICCAREITKKFEAVSVHTTASLLEEVEKGTIPQRGEFVLVVGGCQAPVLSEEAHDMEKILKILLAEMPLKQAVKVANKITAHSKKVLYEYALKLQALEKKMTAS